MPRWKDAKGRFWSKVRKNEPPYGCWVWTGCRADTGYGCFHDRRPYATHRYSWEMHYGPIPRGKCVLHRCDNRGCVRPDHLWIGSKKQNSADMVAKGRAFKPDNAGENHSGAKLDDASVRAILASKAPGVHLAALYGISPSLVSLIRRRKAWAHIS